jgi:hypothetical protein
VIAFESFERDAGPGGRRESFGPRIAACGKAQPPRVVVFDFAGSEFVNAAIRCSFVGAFIEKHVERARARGRIDFKRACERAAHAEHREAFALDDQAKRGELVRRERLRIHLESRDGPRSLKAFEIAYGVGHWFLLEVLQRAAKSEYSGAAARGNREFAAMARFSARLEDDEACGIFRGGTLYDLRAVPQKHQASRPLEFHSATAP